MAVAANALTTLATMKAELGLTDTSKDALLERWVGEASAAIERWCGRSFRLATVSEKLRGSGSQQLLLARTPVVGLPTVKLDEEELEADDFEVDAEAGILYREVGWPSRGESVIGIARTAIPGTGRRYIEVAYAGGYVLPKDEVLAGVTASVPSAVQTLTSPAVPLKSGSLVVTTTAPGGGAAGYTATWKGAALCSGTVPAEELPKALDLGALSADLAGFTLTIATATAGVVAYTVVGSDTAVARTLPLDLERACIEAVKALSSGQKRDPAVSSEALGDYSVTYRDDSQGILPASARDLAEPYRRLA